MVGKKETTPKATAKGPLLNLPWHASRPDRPYVACAARRRTFKKVLPQTIPRRGKTVACGQNKSPFSPTKGREEVSTAPARAKWEGHPKERGKEALCTSKMVALAKLTSEKDFRK
jgi:hypothetical protein